MLPAANSIDSSIGQQQRNHPNLPTDSPDEPKSKAEAGLLQAVRDMKAGRAARVFVPDGAGGMVRSEVARARLASGLTQRGYYRKLIKQLVYQAITD